jgi:predicted transposase/invertase (TIGR01784 family)
VASGIDPKVDYIFKRLFGSEENALLLVSLLNAVICPYPGHVVRGVELLNPFTSKGYAEGKVSILDGKARDDPGRQFHLEMQQILPADYAKRLVYYWSCWHGEQMLQGDRYETLQPTYTICFLNEVLYDDAAYHHTFRIHDDKNAVLLCEDLELHVIELSKFALTADEVKTPLEQWLYFLKHGASLDLDNLPATLELPAIRTAVEVLMRLSQDEIERHQYQERLRVQRDAASLAAHEKNARELALKEGREEGELVGSIRSLQRMLKQPQSSREELFSLARDDLRRMAEALERQISNGSTQTNGTPPPAGA